MRLMVPGSGVEKFVPITREPAKGVDTPPIGPGPMNMAIPAYGGHLAS